MGFDQDILDQIFQYALRWLIGWLFGVIVRTMWHQVRAAVSRRAIAPASRAVPSAARPKPGNRRDRGTRRPAAPQRPGGPTRRRAVGRSRS